MPAAEIFARALPRGKDQVRKFDIPERIVQSPLLMKPHNKQKRSEQDNCESTEHLNRPSHLSPYIAAVLLPGGFAMLPILAWWLDRRRRQRAPQPA